MATKWGICGAGKISNDFAAGVGLLPKGEHELVAVAAQDISRAKDFAKVHGIANAYGSYKDLANDKNVEVVYIGTLNLSHLELGKMMLNAGKHVLCEKPLTMNLKQTKELIELARSKGLFLMEAIWSRCFPAYEVLRQEIAKGSIGDIKQVVAGFGFNLTDITRLIKKSYGGGTILDLGVYAIQFALLVFNHERPVQIKAAGHLNEEGVDVSTSTTLIFKDGRTATIFTQGMVELPNEAQVIGTKGVITLPNFWSPPVIILPSGPKEFKLPEPKLKLNFVNSSGLSYEAAEVRECLKKGLKESPKMTHANSLLIAEIEDEMRKQIGVVYDADK